MTSSPDHDPRATGAGVMIPDSLAQLCQRYYPSLVAVARSILLDVHLAEDAAQEALAEACTGLRSLRDPQSFGPWVGSICRNVAKDILRARKKQRKVAETCAVPEPGQLRRIAASS